MRALRRNRPHFGASVHGPSTMIAASPGHAASRTQAIVPDAAERETLPAPLVWTFDGPFERCLDDLDDSLRRAIVLIGDVSRVALLIDLSLPALLARVRAATRTPILTGLPFGHVPTKVLLPVGARVTRNRSMLGASARIMPRQSLSASTVSGTLPPSTTA